jgi:hypothetical protein
MTVISITVTESSKQVVAGIPRSIALSSNIPATIFYTLDSTDPTEYSEIYTAPIILSSEELKIELRVFATNGTLSSPIITQIYQTNIIANTRLPHAATTAQAGENLPGMYPFGTNPSQPNAQFLNSADAGITVDNPSLTEIPSGYDGYGNETGFTNNEYNLENYSIVYTTRNSVGQPTVGNLPANVTIEIPTAPPAESEQFNNLFDPRALVVFQDYSKENPNDPPNINSEFFSLEDPSKVSSGGLFFNSGLDAPPTMGSFLRSHFNPKDNTITYYYLDTHANRWIISKMPYNPSNNPTGNLSNLVFSRGKGIGVVFEWLPFSRRVLF